jgi:hypothetical protein
MINIYLDTEQVDLQEDICSICHDTLNNNQYKIPECNHLYHSSCIIEWYRTGNIRCPNCNSKPDNLDQDDIYCYSSRIAGLKKYKYISDYCKRKDANIQIIKKVESIRKLNDKLIVLNKDIKTLQNHNGNFKEIHKKIMALKSLTYNIQKNIHNKKQLLSESINILPFIIHKKN